MNGCILADTPIAVDFWQIRQRPHLKIFFLSHMHGDHTKGLSASWRRPIYCSPVTARLLPAKLSVSPSLIKPLEVGESHIIPLDETGQETMTVSVIDANHCPGAVMFLFEGYFGRILYTGDFRYQPSMITDTILSHCGSVDKLYLDNTYNNPKCIWPSRSECAAKILDIISQYPGYEVVIGLHKLGKEELLVDIALAFKTRIVVNPDRLKTLQILEMLDVFTTDSSCSHIRCVPQHLVTRKNIDSWQEGAPTIAILPTALYTSLESQPFADNPDIFVVPYSDHSSQSELIEFVSHIKPTSIIPIVGASKFGMGNDNMTVFDKFLDNSNELGDNEITVPVSVLSFMNSASTTCHQTSGKEGCVMVQPRKQSVNSVNGRKRSSRDLPKGVVFDDTVDEDVTVELKRRKECEQQRDLKQSPNVARDSDDDKTVVSSCNVEHNLHDQAASIQQQCPERNKPSFSTKPTFTESGKHPNDTTGQQPCGDSASNLDTVSKPNKEKTEDVLTMLCSYASKRSAVSQERAQTDGLNTTQKVESAACAEKHKADNKIRCLNPQSSSVLITSATGGDNLKNRSIELNSSALATANSPVGCESTTQTLSKHEQVYSRTVKTTPLQECSTGNMPRKCISANSSFDHKATASVAKSNNHSSHLLVLPYGVRPINRKRGGKRNIYH